MPYPGPPVVWLWRKSRLTRQEKLRRVLVNRLKGGQEWLNLGSIHPITAGLSDGRIAAR